MPDMKSIGMITEFNPLHNGHKLYFDKVREITGGAVTIAIMSGDYVQRGEPAIFDRWTRAELALNLGVDIVAELPVFYSCNNAEVFAVGAMMSLAALGCSDVAFGSETRDIERLRDIAHRYDTPEFRENLDTHLKIGESYATAAFKALGLTSPLGSNDILGVEYIKAGGDKFNYHLVERKGAKHTDIGISGNIASGSAIRRAIYDKQDVSNVMPFHVETSSVAFLEEYYKYIRYNIITNMANLEDIQDVEKGFGTRLYEAACECDDFHGFFQAITSRRYSIGRLQRILLHILIGLTTQMTQQVKSRLPYVRILGFNKHGREYLSELKKKESQEVSIFTSYKNISKTLSQETLELIRFNENASRIYRLEHGYEDRKVPIIYM